MTNNPAPELSPAIASAILAGAPLPTFDATMTLDEAYGVQHDVLGLCAPEGLAGIKGGHDHAGLAIFFRDRQISAGRYLPEDGASLLVGQFRFARAG